MRTYAYIILGSLLSGCAMSVDKDGSVPKTMQESRQANAGSFLGSGITIGATRDNNYENARIGVNSFLWQASLDALSELPLQSADSNGGVIITDWHTDAHASNERIKVTIHILGKKLAPSTIRVRVFRQKYASPRWIDASINAATNRTMEDAILTKARKLRIAALGG